MWVVESPEADAPDVTSAKKRLVLAMGGVALGLAVAGTVDKTVGGVLLLASWLLGVMALHRFGRTGAG